MKAHTVAQGSAEWLALRRGIPTASEFERIVTPTGKLSSQAPAYMHFLLAEKLLGTSLKALDHLEWVQRGKELELEAVAQYEFEESVRTEPVGFCTTDDGRIGASPDRLVATTGTLEIKCPAPQTHIGYMLNGFGPAYWVQVQGQLLVSERDWVDRLSYHPSFPSVMVRSNRDEVFIAILRHALDEFCDRKDEAEHRLRAAGYVAQQPAQTPVDAAMDEWVGGRHPDLPPDGHPNMRWSG